MNICVCMSGIWLKENAEKGIFIKQARTILQHFNIIDIQLGVKTEQEKRFGFLVHPIC